MRRHGWVTRIDRLPRTITESWISPWNVGVKKSEVPVGTYITWQGRYAKVERNEPGCLEIRLVIGIGKKRRGKLRLAKCTRLIDDRVLLVKLM